MSANNLWFTGPFWFLRFGVGFPREAGAKLSGLMPVLDHEMVQQNSPGLQPWVTRRQRTRPERATDERCFFQEAAFIATVATSRSTTTQTEIFRAIKHDVSIEAPFGCLFRAGLVLGDSQG